ncbi:polysaccharide pyruvyl transferase family protein [Dietzia psychralcaliphila]|uniref:polysaccharide pyruvyl transferase family protein n=1 Tax=Dietzia psychralcaliphila TaxID=139021 RepID=UPI001C1E7592|nr:polysaccharide pyruvyl transferase family protein [Dietzia psychralcaliphila]
MTSTPRAAPASRLRRRARRRLDATRAAADARWGRPREVHRPVYLIAPAGHPNHGDEQLLAGWLRHLRHSLPGTPVVVDCHTPGQAAVLHHGEHPDVLFTDTLWRLAGEHAGAVEAVGFCRRAVGDLGARPELASGIDLLRSASVVHLIGGGYVNDLWPHHLGVVAAAGEAGRLAGARVVATGQGFVPCRDAERLAGALRDYHLVTVRDAASFDLLAGTGVPVRHVADDGWLAMSGAGGVEAGDHPVYSSDPDACRDLVLCAQSDLVEPEVLADAVGRVLVAWAVAGERITVIESIPGGDRVVWDMLCDRAEAASGAGGGPGGQGDDDEVGRALAGLHLPRARFVPFQELWLTGLPARPGQVWLTSRFHPHLFAAARGASGVALRTGSAFYDVKHGSLRDSGSPWVSVGAEEGLRARAAGAEEPDAAGLTGIPAMPDSGGFAPATVAALVSGAERLAEEIYPVDAR